MRGAPRWARQRSSRRWFDPCCHSIRSKCRYKVQGAEVGAVLTPVLKPKQDCGGRVHKHGSNTIAFWDSETPASWAYLPHDTSYSFPSLCRDSGPPSSRTLATPRVTKTSGSSGPLADRSCQGLCEGKSSRGRRKF